jgi:hypothetical protein
LDTNERRFQASSSSNISSRIGEDQKEAVRISSDGHIFSGIEEDQKQVKEHEFKVSSKDHIAEVCPTNEVAQIDLTVMTLEADDGSYPGVAWKLISFGTKKIIKGLRSFQLTKPAGSNKWVAGESWLQGQYTKDKCAIVTTSKDESIIGQCRCKSKVYSRNFDTWTLAEKPCVAEWPPGEIQVGSKFSAAPPQLPTALPLVVTGVTKLSEYGQHPSCPKVAMMDTGHANHKYFWFLWKAPAELIVLTPGFICNTGYHMEGEILEGSSQMCDDAGSNCRFGMIDTTAITCNNGQWENFPTCVEN